MGELAELSTKAAIDSAEVTRSRDSAEEVEGLDRGYEVEGLTIHMVRPGRVSLPNSRL